MIENFEDNILDKRDFLIREIIKTIWLTKNPF